MDIDFPTERSADFEGVIKMTLTKAEEAVAEFQQIEDGIAQADAFIKAGRERQAVLNGIWNQCVSTGELFGFDLQHERRQARLRDELNEMFEGHWSNQVPEKQKTVREHLIDLGRGSKGQPLRASSVRDYLHTEYGLELHEKTVGMTLYRLSKEGAFTRRGRDWYFVPEAERSQGILERIDVSDLA